LDAKTLKQKNSYSAGAEFISSPVIFEHKDKALLAAATKEGRIHLLDAGTLVKLAVSSESSDLAPGAVASWQDSSGTRWILAAGRSSIIALKVAEPGIQPGWVSRAITSPQTPTIVNGVVFAVSGGSSRATLYALDGATGKELWNSGNTINAAVRSGI